MCECVLPTAEPELELTESTRSYLAGLIHQFCTKDDLSTYDPYDIWKTRLGFRVKNLYNSRPRVGVLPAGLLALFDDVVNNGFRLFYRRTEYPIVRALAALCLLNLYRNNRDGRLLDYAHQHLQWLLANTCTGYRGLCWGLGTPNAVSKGLVYEHSTPYSTMTPYVLEALVSAAQIWEHSPFEGAIESIFRFLEEDLQVMEEDEEALATSYGPFQDRTVINAVSYTMYSYALLMPYMPGQDKHRIQARVNKLYAYIRRHQRADGSWLYSPHGRSFIDCFHSCIVLKNVIKTDRIMRLTGSECLVVSGYEYLKTAFLDEHRFLFRRFSLKNKPGLVRFDLYDNAEVLNLALLLGDRNLFERLLTSTIRHFCRNHNIYSQIDFLGILRNKNTLRWAVMPFLCAVSQL